jgi:flagellar basal body-associated protein FliL
MSVFQRQLLLTVLLAGLAGFAGVWFGAHGLQSDNSPPAPLRLAVDELTRRGLGGLTDAQKSRITDIEVRYSHKRTKLRTRIAAANVELADALAVEMTLGPKVETSIEDLKGVIGELQHETVAYVLELRAVLSEQQQMVFDEKVVAALMTPPS